MENGNFIFHHTLEDRKMVFQSSWTVIEDRIGTENTAARPFQSAKSNLNIKNTISNNRIKVYILVKKKFTRKLVHSSF